jgi:phospholipid-binding lipoprotein MlaA
MAMFTLVLKCNIESWRRRALQLFGLTTLALLQACATVAYPDPRDPMESFNRGVFTFNDKLDRAVLKPVATVYQDATPHWVRKGVSNFFNNLEDVWSVVNNSLQLRGQDATDSFGRVLINSTIGLAGVMEVAGGLGLERHTANFGLTLGRWGVKPGPYIVLPLLGPSTLREVVALPIDYNGNLLNSVTDVDARDGLWVLSVVDARAGLLQAGQLMDQAALDPYSFMRDGYLQRRRNQVYDGNPPEEDSTQNP